MSDNPLNDEIRRDGYNNLEDLFDDVAELKARENKRLPYARVYNNANILVPDSTQTVLTFTNVRWDTNSFFDLATPTRLTVNLAGNFKVSFHCSYAANVTGYRQVFIRLNGSNILAVNNKNSLSTAGAQTRISVFTEWQSSVGDYFEIVTFQTSGGNLNILQAASYSPEFLISKIG